MANWPSELPQTPFYQFTSKRQSAVVRSSMETGPAKQRPRFTAAVRNYDCSMKMTGVELAVFETFYETTLGRGAVSFTWTDPITTETANLRFREEPEVTALTGHDDPDKRIYDVTLPLEKMP